MTLLTGGVRFLGAAGTTLKLLYDMDLISEEAVVAWKLQKEAAAAAVASDAVGRCRLTLG
jgi:hypothetical protein